MFGWFRKRKTEEETYLEELERRKAAPEGAFRMTVEDVFCVYREEGQSVVVTGVIEAGRVQKGDRLAYCGDLGTGTVTVAGIESFRKVLPSAQAGDRVGLLFRQPGRQRTIGQGTLLTKE